MEKSHVTMEQKMCPICGVTEDSGAILLDKRLRPKFDMYTTTGYGLCKVCQKKKDDGYLAIIICDPSKGAPNDGMVKLEEVYRTGGLIHIKKEVAKNIFPGMDITRDFVFGDIAVIGNSFYSFE